MQWSLDILITNSGARKNANINIINIIETILFLKISKRLFYKVSFVNVN